MNGPGLEKSCIYCWETQRAGRGGEERLELSLASAEFAYSRDAAEEPSKPGPQRLKLCGERGYKKGFGVISA